MEQLPGKLLAERLGLLRGARDAVADVFTAFRQRDESGYRHLVAVEGRVRGDGRLAARLEDTRNRAFGKRGANRRRVIELREDAAQIGCVVQALDADDALCGGREHLFRCELLADAVVEAEALETRRCEDDRVVVAGIELGETRVDVAAQRLDG